MYLKIQIVVIQNDEISQHPLFVRADSLVAWDTFQEQLSFRDKLRRQTFLTFQVFSGKQPLVVQSTAWSHSP